VEPVSVDLAAVLRRLSELGPPSEIRARAPSEAASALGFDRVLLTSVERGSLVPDSLHAPADPRADVRLAALRERPPALEYPLIEGELMRLRLARVVRSGEAPSRRAYADALGWADYVIAPMLLDGRAIGFLHADRDGPLDDVDATRLAEFALCLVLVFERAVLRRRLRIQRAELRQIAAWADARTSDLGDRSITLSEADDAAEPESAGHVEPQLRDLLTRRELDVLELMVRGDTNAAIARELVVSEGTIKFHVKNILRKLHATNRAEATSRYLRLTLNARH
jgi:DNA-binding CsgD family transcriptional regulator